MSTQKSKSIKKNDSPILGFNFLTGHKLPTPVKSSSVKELLDSLFSPCFKAPADIALGKNE